MTWREKVAREEPHRIGSYTLGGIKGCPADHIEAGTCEAGARGVKEGTTSEICKACWDREIPEKKEQILIEPIVKDDTLTFKKHTVDGLPKDASGYPLEGHPDPVGEPGEPGEPGIPVILDSGNRRQFESGAVRDIQEGKGRCDLLPLDVVSSFMNDAVTGYIHNFQETGDAEELYNAWDSFAEQRWHDNPTMFLEVSKHFEEGAKKYGENNWQKGIPVHCYIDSAVRHYLKFLRGDKDEPHDRAFCWNIMCAIWTCNHKPELNEYAKEE